MKRLFVSIVAMLMAACMLFVSFAEDAENSPLVKEAAEIIAAATADERQEIFKDLIWYMIFVDGADAVEEAFSVVGMFFAGDDMPAELIPEGFAAQSDEAQQLTNGQSVEIADCCAIEVVRSGISAQIVPSNGDSMYYEAGSGKQFVVLNISFTNLNTDNICPDELMKCKLVYEGKYNYEGNVVTELSGSFIPGGEVMPLCTEKICMFFEVPDVVAESDSPIEITITVNNGAEYTYSVR